MLKKPLFTPSTYVKLSPTQDEYKLRQLANEMAKGIVDPLDILKTVGVTPAEFDELKETHAYRHMYAEALGEWEGANNTQKRVKLKAAATVEVVMHEFYQEMRNRTEPLTARTELLKTLARIGGLGNPEPMQTKNSGQFFKLEIHIDGKKDPIVIGASSTSDEVHAIRESALAQEEPYDDL